MTIDRPGARVFQLTARSGPARPLVRARTWP